MRGPGPRCSSAVAEQLRREELGCSDAATRIAEFWMSDAGDADLSTRQSLTDLEAAQQSVLSGSWSWLRQVHSDRTVVVGAPGDCAGDTGDASVTSVPDAVIAVQVADCVPVGFWTSGGSIAVAHAGWRGALVGVLEATVRALRTEDPEGTIDALVGPHICARCYEFGATDLATMRQRFGAHVERPTSEGTPGLDMTAVIAAELNRLDVSADFAAVQCTACAGGFWSHRARAETGRQALVGVLR